MIGVALAVVEGGADDIEAAAGTSTLSPAAWRRWNDRAVWCSLEGIGDEAPTLRISVHAEHGVLELGDERALVPATSVLGWFWRACGLSSSYPEPEPEFDVELALAAVSAWLDGEEPPGGVLPPAVRLRVGWGGEALRDEILLASGEDWMRGRRIPSEGGLIPAIGAFSMKHLVLDLSALLALAPTRD